MDFNTAERRKVNKPLTERRRRERINISLLQLKSIVLRATGREENVKMEKADILEMTIRFIEDIQNNQLKSEIDTTQLSVSSYLQGYSKCANEVATSLGGAYSGNDVASSLSGHLSANYATMTTEFQTQNYYSAPQPQHSSPLSRESSLAACNYLTRTPCPSHLPSLKYHGASLNQTSPVLACESSPRFDWSSHCNVPLSSQRYSSSSNSSYEDDDSGIDNSVWRPW